MMWNPFKYLLIVLFLAPIIGFSQSQSNQIVPNPPSKTDSIPFKADSTSVSQLDSVSQDSIKKVNGFDSSKYYYLDEDSTFYAEIIKLNPVLIFHKKYPTTEEQYQFNKTKYIVRKVWPYYISALENMAEVDLALVDVNKRRKQKKVVKSYQKELRLEFENELKQLTVSEGKTLIKMIERKTGLPFYDLIKEYRGTFEALKWNTLAFTLGYSLKKGYDPIEWEYLELIMNAIEE